MDNVNAMLSFVYAAGQYRCTSALETVGLDVICGIYAYGPARPPFLALDLMEEAETSSCRRRFVLT